jgi:hypothetical protein
MTNAERVRRHREKKKQAALALLGEARGLSLVAGRATGGAGLLAGPGSGGAPIQVPDLPSSAADRKEALDAEIVSGLRAIAHDPMASPATKAGALRTLAEINGALRTRGEALDAEKLRARERLIVPDAETLARQAADLQREIARLDAMAAKVTAGNGPMPRGSQPWD